MVEHNRGALVVDGSMYQYFRVKRKWCIRYTFLPRNRATMRERYDFRDSLLVASLCVDIKLLPLKGRWIQARLAIEDGGVFLA